MEALQLIKEFAPYIFALITALAVAKLTDKGSQRGQETSAALENRRIDIDGKSVNLTVLTESIDALRHRLDDVEKELTHEKEQRRLSNGFARTLARILREEGIAVPPQPAGLDLD